jgi:dUTP pyrophosphatase
MAAAAIDILTTDLQVRLLHPAAVPPRRAHEHDAGFDLACVEDFTLWPARRRGVGTGVAIALPVGMAGLVTPRSGLAARHGVTIVNAPGLVDPGYRG